MKEVMTFIIFFIIFCVEGVIAKPPNILLIISDDLNTQIGPYINIDQHTPHLDRLAQEGVSFTKMYAQYPQCGPSRASFMSGLYPETNLVLKNSYKLGSYRAENDELKDHPSLAGFFREHGYYTARISKIFHMGIPGDIENGTPGADDPDSWDYVYNVMAPETYSRGQLELLSPQNHHYGSNFSRMIIPDQYKTAQADYLAASQAIAFLEARTGEVRDSEIKSKKRDKEEAPFFLAVGFIRPHVPLIAPEDCYALYPEEEMVVPSVNVGKNVPIQALRRQNDKLWGMNMDQKKKAISGYMASVRFMDQQVGRLLDAMDRLGIREETIVVFMSDHGYNLGEHDCWSKVSLWEGSVRAPFIISEPGSRRNDGTTCPFVSELIDLYPTLADLAGLKDKLPQILQGKSLADFISGERIENEDRYAYTVTNGGKDASIRSNRWRYTLWSEANGTQEKEELYDHSNDPEENNNLVDVPEYSDVLQLMRYQMAETKNRAKKD